MAAEQATTASKPVEIRPGVQRVLLGETAFEISTRYQLRKPIGHGAYGESRHIRKAKESSIQFRILQVLLCTYSINEPGRGLSHRRVAQRPSLSSVCRSALDSETGKKVAIKKIP